MAGDFHGHVEAAVGGKAAEYCAAERSERSFAAGAAVSHAGGAWVQRFTEEVRSDPKAQPGMAVPQKLWRSEIAFEVGMGVIRLSPNSFQKSFAGRFAVGICAGGEFAQFGHGNGAVREGFVALAASGD